jgi:pimeloyl-ACP methyl ester carboxylesterase
VRAYRMPELVADVLALAEAAGAARFHLVGHDWGGAVAWAPAGQHPEQVATLTSVSTPHPRALAAALLTSGQLLRSAYIGFFRIPRLPELVLGARGSRGLRFLLARSGLGPQWAERYARALARPGALAAALVWYRAAVRFGMAVPRVPVPTRYVWGSGDPALGRRPRPVPVAGSPGPTASTSWKGPATGCPSTTPRSWPSCSWSTWRLPAPTRSPAADPGLAALWLLASAGGAAG